LGGPQFRKCPRGFGFQAHGRCKHTDEHGSKNPSKNFLTPFIKQPSRLFERPQKMNATVQHAPGEAAVPHLVPITFARTRLTTSIICHCGFQIRINVLDIGRSYPYLRDFAKSYATMAVPRSALKKCPDRFVFFFQVLVSFLPFLLLL
jgi:hypothetical protein